ncbi:MAG: hypothetical protein E6J54_10940 [Deltaproteobacteria bacterium]|nr:MAG: hypothetical protein E6J54_10940 [Deltaproteobacteria bacterium]
MHADRTIGPVLGKDEEREESDSFEYEHGYRLNEIALQGLTIEFLREFGGATKVFSGCPDDSVGTIDPGVL